MKSRILSVLLLLSPFAAYCMEQEAPAAPLQDVALTSHDDDDKVQYGCCGGGICRWLKDKFLSCFKKCPPTKWVGAAVPTLGTQALAGWAGYEVASAITAYGASIGVPSFLLTTFGVSMPVACIILSTLALEKLITKKIKDGTVPFLTAVSALMLTLVESGIDYIGRLAPFWNNTVEIIYWCVAIPTGLAVVCVCVVDPRKTIKFIGRPFLEFKKKIDDEVIALAMRVGDLQGGAYGALT